MSKYQKNLPKKFVPTDTPDNPFRLFLALLLLFFLSACAERALPPKLQLENPLRFLDSPPDPAFQSVYANYEKGRMQKARTEFEKLLKSSPKHYPAYLAVGYTYLAEGNEELAEQYIHKSLELAPDYAQAHFALAFIHEKRQDYDAALAEMEAVIGINPEYPSAQQSRNLTRLKATEKHLAEGEALADKDPAEALRHLRVAMELAPDIGETPRKIAQIYLKQNNCSEAIPYLETANEKIAEDPELMLQLADCLLEIQQLDRALILYQKLLVMQPQNQEVKGKMEAIRKQIFVRNLPDEYQQIPTASEISRSQFASYLMVNLDFLERYTSGETKIIVDTLDHWAHPYILKTVNLGIIDLFPNRSFQPNLAITRLELAKAVSRILEILEVPGNAQFTVSVPDVSENNVYYPMIALAISAGVLSLDADGRFHPSRAVSGAEVISIVSQLKILAEKS